MNFNIFQWRSLKTRVTLFTLFIFLIGIWSLALYESRKLREDMHHLLGDQQFSTVSFIAENINEELNERLNVLNLIAGQVSPTIQGNPATIQEILGQSPILQFLFNGGVTVLSDDGTTIADVPLSAGRIGVNYMDREHIAAALKEGKASVARPLMGRKLHAPIVSMTTPIRDVQGNVIGTLVGVIDLGKPNILDKITEGHYGKTGDYFLTAVQYRQIVTTSNKRRIMEELPASGINSLIDRFIQGYEGTAIGVNPVGVEVLASAKGIPSAGWYVAIAMPTEEAFAPIRTMLQRMLLTTLFMTLLVGGLSWWMLRRLFSPVQAATETLATLSNTNQPLQPLPITSQDEIGILIGGFNCLLETLKKREEALKESEKKLLIIFRHTPAGLILMDGQSVVLDCNQYFANMFGTQREKYLGAKLLDRIPEGPVRQSLVDAISDDVIHRYEGPYTSIFSEKELFISLSSVKIAPHLIIAIIRDITENKRAEELLKESEARYRQLFENAPAGIYEIDLTTGRMLSVNDSICEYTGYAKGELLTMNALDILTEESQKIFIERMAGFAAGKPVTANLDFKARSKSGREFWMSINPKYFYKEGIPVRASVVAHDITERKRLEAEKAQLETQNRQLQKAESLGRMAGAIAHNFNNQLQVVIGNLEMAIDDKSCDSECLDEALKAAHKAADVSALMLTYLGQKSGKQEPIDLSEVCRRRYTLLQSVAPKDMILNADFPPAGPVIRANADQILDVLTKLVNNAWESAEENQRTIGLTVKTVSQKEIPAFKRFPAGWNPQESVYACLELVDAGCGISCEDIEKIFDPFYSTKFTGRGMGLSVVLGIVKAHNGGITVESEPGQGSVFRVYLPVTDEEVTHSPEKAGKAPEIIRGRTVLLIEDEDPVRNMAKKMLTRLGYTVLEAKDGAEAVDIFQKHLDEILCVLSDLTMPRMNGWETLAALRNISPIIPVILSSGYDEAHVMVGEHTEQPNAFLGKPYQLKGLRETIKRVLTAPDV